MPCVRTGAVLVAVMASVAHAQGAEPNFVFNVKREGGVLKCSPGGGAGPVEQGNAAFVKVVPGSGIVITRTEFTGDGGAPIRPSPPMIVGGSSLYQIDRNGAATQGGLNVTLTVSGGSISCEQVGPLFKNGGPGADTPAGVDALAGTWFSEHGEGAVKALQATPRSPSGVYFLLHLPSGAPLYPFPAALTEGKTVQVAIVLPKGDPRVMEMDLVGCGVVNTFRTDVNTSQVSPDGVKEAGKRTPRDAFVIAPIGQYFSCGAGEVSYTLRARKPTSNPPTAGATPGSSGPEPEPEKDEKIATSKIRFRPKSHLGLIAFLGWDTAKRKSFAAEPAGVGTDAMIVEHQDQVGAQAYVGAVWMIGGVDYEDMKPHNYIANLFIAANPANPIDDFALGLAITPTGGVSIGLGISFHKGVELEGLRVKDPFTGMGDVPTRSTWSAAGFGFILGVTIDSQIYDALIKRFAK